MKHMRLEGISHIDLIPGANDAWYYGIDYLSGDLYEAEELFLMGKTPKGNVLKLVHFPDGAVYTPLARRDGQYLGTPVYLEGAIYLLAVDFTAAHLQILSFDTKTAQVLPVVCLPLSEVKDCYNLMLHTEPLMLSRQPGDATLDILWPEKKVIAIGSRESFFLRQGNLLYFSEWFEDPDYREEVVVRDLRDGSVVERFAGDLRQMPDGQLWHLF